MSGKRGGGARVAPELVARVREEPTQAIDVLIEADVPSPSVVGRSRQRGSRPAQLDVRDLTSVEVRERELRIADLKESLERILGAAPSFFKYANAFRARVTPDQLEKISELPLVRFVSENRVRAR